MIPRNITIKSIPSTLTFNFEHCDRSNVRMYIHMYVCAGGWGGGGYTGYVATVRISLSFQYTAPHYVKLEAISQWARPLQKRLRRPITFPLCSLMRGGGFSGRERGEKIFKITMQIGGEVKTGAKQRREETISSLDCNIRDRSARSITPPERGLNGTTEAAT